MFALTVLKIGVLGLLTEIFQKNRMVRSWSWFLFAAVVLCLLPWLSGQGDLFKKSLWFFNWVDTSVIKIDIALRTGPEYAPFIWTQIIILKDRIGFIDFAKATLDINHNGGVFIDIRKPEEFKAGHIHGALDIAPEMLLSGNFSRITCNKDAKIVVVSHTNDDTQAYNCAKALKKSGYQNTFLLRGGMLDLQSSNIPLSKK